MKNENKFQAELIKDLKNLFPGCIIMKNDPNYIQGIPDLTVCFKNHWAFLECKKDKDSSFRPNQLYYLDKAKEWSYGAEVDQTNKEEVLNEIQQAFRT